MAIPFVYSYGKGARTSDRRLFPQHKGHVQDVPIGEIVVPEDKASLSPEDVEEMEKRMRNIREKGLLQPIMAGRLPDGRYSVLAGVLRLQACKNLGWKTVPVEIRDEDGCETAVQ